MKFFLTLLTLLAFATPTMAQDLFVKKQKDTPPPVQHTAQSFANEYFGNCLKKQNEILTPGSQEMLCACTAAKLSETMTVTEMEAMYTDTPEGQNMRNKMLLQVYAPCIQYPTKDLVMHGCLQNDVKMKQKQKVCGCMADNMASYISINAQSVLISALQQDPTSTDPLGTLLNSSAFASQAQKTLAICIQQHELGAR